MKMFIMIHKKILTLCICLIIFHIANYQTSNATNTSLINTTNEVDDIGWFTSLAIDEYNIPHISYYDYTNADLKYCYKQQDTWVIQTVDSIDDVGKYTSLALDDTNKAHISYYDTTNGNLKYARQEDNDWNIETIDSIGNVGLYTSIDLDSQNHPHISYLQYDTRTLKYASFDGTTWKKGVVDNSATIGADDYFCDYTSLVIDASDQPHISYCDIEQFDLKYASYENGNWYKEVVDSDGDVGVYSSLALDSEGQPHISYADFTNPSFDLKYATKQGTEWQIQDADTDGDIRKWTSLSIDSNQIPHISFYDYSKGSLELTYNIENDWQKETIELKGSTGCFNSLGITSDDRIYISYYDWGNKALKFAYKQEDIWVIETIEEDTNTDTIDQEQIYCSGYALGIPEGKPLAQSFIPDFPVLTRVELMIVKRYNPGDFTFSIRDHLDGEELVTMHVSAADISEDIAWKAFDILDLPVQKNQIYYMVCSSNETEEYNQYFWYFGHPDPYPKGEAWNYDSHSWEQLEISGYPHPDFGFKTFGLNTSIPIKPIINGPTSGKIYESYIYTISSEDADGDLLYYEIEWDENERERIGPYPSGENVSIQHTWNTQGAYHMRVKAIDQKGAESEWISLEVTIPKQRKYFHLSFFEFLFNECSTTLGLLENILQL